MYIYNQSRLSSRLLYYVRKKLGVEPESEGSACGKYFRFIIIMGYMF